MPTVFEMLFATVSIGDDSIWPCLHENRINEILQFQSKVFHIFVDTWTNPAIDSRRIVS